MTYVTVLRNYPAAGEGPEMRPGAEGFTKALQAAGIDAQLSQSTWGTDHPWFQVGMRWATLADREQAAPALASAAAQFGTPAFWALTRQAPTTGLLELLQTTNPGGTPKWAVTVSVAPALGKSGELRALLLQSGKQYEAQGLSTSLLVRVDGPETGNLARVFNFNSLADLEAWRAGIDIDSDYARKRDALLIRPLQSTIREVLIQFPTR